MKKSEFDLTRANACFLRGDYKSAFSMYLNAAVSEHLPEAAFNVAYMYYHGLFVPQSYALARRYYMAAQMLDGGAAQFNLALMCLRGQGVPADYSEAARYMKISAANDCVNAQLYLGVAYTIGCMFDPQEIECLSLIPYYRVVKRDAQALLAGDVMQLDDARFDALEPDEFCAAEMFAAAAAHKDTTYISEQVGAGQELLGHALIEGLGVSYDPEAGYQMLERAVEENGSVRAAIFLEQNKEKALIYGVNTEKSRVLLEEASDERI